MREGSRSRVFALGLTILLLALLLIFYKVEMRRTLRAALDGLEEGEEALTFSMESGFFEEGFALAIVPAESIPQDGSIEIHYTLNGDVPTKDSPVYTGSIDLSEAAAAALQEQKEQAAERAAVIGEAEKDAGQATSGAGTEAAQAADTTPSVEDGRRSWQEELWLSTADSGLRPERSEDGICVIPVRACLFQREDSSRVFTRTYVIGPGVKDRFSDVSVACVSIDEEELFDYVRGLMVSGSHYESDIEAGVRADRAGNPYQTGDEWVRDGHVTLFSSTGEVLLEEDTGLSIAGYSSRGLPTRSFRAIASTEHGSSGDHFTLPGFFSGYTRESVLKSALKNASGSEEKRTEGDPAAGTEAVSAANTEAVSAVNTEADSAAAAEPASGQASPLDTFRKLKFRTHGVPSYHIRSVRNEYAKCLSDEWGFPGLTENRPGVMFLNGEFYTVCDLAPSGDRDYLCRIFDLHVPDAVEKYSGSDVDVFTKAKILRLLSADLRDPDNQAALERAVDMDNYLQYYAMEVLFNNVDWPYNNMTIWRYLGEKDPENPYTDGRIRFVLDDMDQILTNDMHGDPKRWSTELIDYLMKDSGATFYHVMQCEKYRDTFLTYVDDMLKTAFEPDYACSVLDELYSALKREYILDYGEDFWAEMEDTAELTKRNVREKETLYRANIETYMGLAATDRYSVRIEAGEGCTVTWNNDCGRSPDKKTESLAEGEIWESEYYCGTSFTAEAAPEDGYRILGWKITLESDGKTEEISDSFEEENPAAIRISDTLLPEEAGIKEDACLVVRAVAESLKIRADAPDF